MCHNKDPHVCQLRPTAGFPVAPKLISLHILNLDSDMCQLYVSEAVEKFILPGQWLILSSLAGSISNQGLPRWCSGNQFACQPRRRRSDSWVEKNPWRRKWQLTPILLPGKSHGQSSLAGYTVHGAAELDMTEHTCTSCHAFTVKDSFVISLVDTANIILLVKLIQYIRKWEPRNLEAFCKQFCKQYVQTQ